MSRDLIHQSGRVHPGGNVRDVTELSKRVEELSRQLSADERPQTSSRFIDKVAGGDDTIDLEAGQLNGVVHGLGRKYRGWHLAGISAAAVVYEPDDAELSADGADVDKTTYLPLKCTADCTIKLVVW